MHDYASWDETTKSVTALLLDPRNPRIPSGAAPLSQRDLIAELVEHENVYPLAQDIALRGYFPVESLIGVEDEDGKTYILEGNRRLAALKLLISPDTAPETWVAKFRALKPTTPVQRVRVLYAPKREDAAPIILQKHTRQQIERWSPLMQARFYRSLVQSGSDLATLASQYGVTAAEIADFLRTDEMYRIACLLDVPSDVRKVIDDPREFPGSLLQRLIGFPKVREFLGIEFDGTGSVKGSIDKSEFTKGYGRILSDIVREKIDSRTLNTREDAAKYLSALGADTPDRSKKAAFTYADLSNASASPPVSTPKPPAASPRPTSPRLSSTVIPTGTKCQVANRRIREVFTELRRLKPDNFPNSSAVMLRILLELCIANYMDKSGKLKPILEKARTKDKKAKDWSPTLRQMIVPLLEDPDLDIDPQARKRVNKLVSQKDSPLSLDDLDAFVHNQYVAPTSREIHALWGVLAGLFKLVLTEPPPPPKSSGNKN
jgi:hypothetical protein